MDPRAPLPNVSPWGGGMRDRTHARGMVHPVPTYNPAQDPILATYRGAGPPGAPQHLASAAPAPAPPATWGAAPPAGPYHHSGYHQQNPRYPAAGARYAGPPPGFERPYANQRGYGAASYPPPPAPAYSQSYGYGAVELRLNVCVLHYKDWVIKSSRPDDSMFAAGTRMQLRSLCLRPSLRSRRSRMPCLVPRLSIPPYELTQMLLEVRTVQFHRRRPSWPVPGRRPRSRWRRPALSEPT